MRALLEMGLLHFRLPLVASQSNRRALHCMHVVIIYLVVMEQVNVLCKVWLRWLINKDHHVWYTILS